MLEILEFIFQNFWTWLGTVILLCAVGMALSGLRLFTINFRKESNRDESESAHKGS